MREIFRLLYKAYQNNEFDIILNHRHGNYFLKLRSLSRTEILRQLAERAQVNIDNIQGRQLFEHLFCQNIPQAVIDTFIKEIYQQERSERIGNEENLYTQLFRL